MTSDRSILLIYYFVILGPFLAFVISPLVLITLFAARGWRSLARPWSYIGVSVLVLYALGVVFVYLAFVLAVSFTGMGIYASRATPRLLLEQYSIPLCVYVSLAAFVACSIGFLGFLRSLWSK